MAVARTLDTAVDESRKNMADRVAMSPAQLVAETGSFVTIDALSAIFLLFCLASLFSYFSPPVCFSPSCCFVRAAVICSSSASTCSCDVCILSHGMVPFVLLFIFRIINKSFCFLGWRVCFSLVPGTLTFDFSILQPHSRIGDNLLGIRVNLSPKRVCNSKGVKSRYFFCFVSQSVRPTTIVPKNKTGFRNTLAGFFSRGH